MNRRCLVAAIFLLDMLHIPSGSAQTVEAFADRVQKTYEQASDVSMEFVQKTYVAVLEREVSKRGDAKFKKPGKLFIRYLGDRGRRYISNGKTLWINETGDAQVQSYPLNEETMPAEALSFLGGLGNLKRDFAVESVDERKWGPLKRGKDGLEWMELTPLKKRSTLQWLIMGFDPTTALAKEAYLATDSGNLSHYVFEKVQLNTRVGDEVFEFSAVKKNNS